MLEERIIAEDDTYYVIATLGQITDGGYALIVPKRHVSCIGEMTPGEIEEMAVWEERLSLAIRETGWGPSVCFEHGKVGQTVQHAHLHVVPAELWELTARVEKDFPTRRITAVNSFCQLREAYTDHLAPYLFWRLGDGVHRICWDPPAPKQYLRIIVAELLGRPERADWKKMDADLDKRLWQETVSRLKQHFPKNP
ncbi:MAG: hypothetical protein BMS9Abin13_538 [Patescibacteria group bacterium]|nr:MAG: hypothetical protein BMS9Abin13_538 [Patescibacteria group bacterium]